MISYDPLWNTMRLRNVTTYDLIYNQGVSSYTIHRMKHGEAVTTKTIEVLCEILHCGVSDILVYIPEE